MRLAGTAGFASELSNYDPTQAVPPESIRFDPNDIGWFGKFLVSFLLHFAQKVGLFEGEISDHFVQAQSRLLSSPRPLKILLLQ